MNRTKLCFKYRLAPDYQFFIEIVDVEGAA
jgi:hypothetical protein